MGPKTTALAIVKSLSRWFLIGTTFVASASCPTLIDRWLNAAATSPNVPPPPASLGVSMDRVEPGMRILMPSYATGTHPKDAETSMLAVLQQRLPSGSDAPDMKLLGLAPGATFKLSSHRKVKPVVLVFGSFTCNTFVSSIPDLNRLYDEFKDRVAFAMIVSADAGHVIPGFEFLQPNPETPAPGQSGKHCELLQQAAEVAGLRVPVFLDSPDYDACRAYKAWPARLVLVNSDGRVEYDFGPPVPSLQRWVMADVREAVRLLCAKPAPASVRP